MVWSFYFGGDSAWSLIGPAVLGLIVCNGVLLYAYQKMAEPDWK